MVLFPTTVNEIISIINNLSSKVSFGFDNIPTNVVKLSAPYIATQLSYLINYSFDRGIFPDQLKIGKICPIHKQGDKKLIANYRPISILPVFSKVYEKAIYTRLDSFLKSNNILTDNQYGFRKGHSTFMPNQDLYDKISLASQNNEHVIAIFLDLAKAFDTIDHSIMCDKLYYCRVRGTALELFRNYLSNRKQYVSYNGVTSRFLDVSLGVPQGSILGPLLFIVYINDFVKSTSTLTSYLFADDTTVLHSDRDFINLTSMVNSELCKISAWFKSNRLTLNAAKSNYIIFGSKRLPSTDCSKLISMDGTYLGRVESTKFLGVLID